MEWNHCILRAGNWEVKIKLVRERDAIAHQRGCNRAVAGVKYTSPKIWVRDFMLKNHIFSIKNPKKSNPILYF